MKFTQMKHGTTGKPWEIWIRPFLSAEFLWFNIKLKPQLGIDHQEQLGVLQPEADKEIGATCTYNQW